MSCRCPSSYDDWKTTEPEERSWRDEPPRPGHDPLFLAEERRRIAHEELRALDRTAGECAESASIHHRDFLFDRISEHLRHAEGSFADFSRDREVMMHQLGATRFHLCMAAKLTRDLREHLDIEDRENDEIRALARSHELQR